MKTAKNVTVDQIDALQDASAYVRALQLICVGETINGEQLNDLLKPIEQALSAALSEAPEKAGDQ